MTMNLAPVYLDDARVQLQGDPRPPVSKILQAGGKAGRAGRVLRLRSLHDRDGTPLGLDDVVDRSGSTSPVYLRCDNGTSLAADESTGVGTVTAQECGGAGRGRPDDPDSSIGNRVAPGGTRHAEGGASHEDFGAARPGMAGRGAEGSPGQVPVDVQTKSDYGLDERDGASNATYGVGDLAPGGRTGITDRLEAGTPTKGRPDRPRGQPDSTQEFQSGGRSGEGLEASFRRDAEHRGASPLVAGDEGVGSPQRRQAAGPPASGVQGKAQGAQGRTPVEPDDLAGGELRDSSTDNQGRQQAQGH